MAKDPAFLFYPGDYIGGTMGMTFEEKGAYVDLLMMQFNRGHMTNDMIAQTVGHLWVKLKDKFRQDENGLWYNERLDKEKFLRAAYTQSRRNNVSGSNQYSKKATKKKGHMSSHMEDENENENVNRSEDQKNAVQKNPNNFPTYESHGSLELLEHLFNSAAVVYKNRNPETLSRAQVLQLWTSFKIINFTGKAFYQDDSEIYKHFLNWLPSQKISKQYGNKIIESTKELQGVDYSAKL